MNKTDQNLLSPKNKYIQFLLKHQQVIILSILLIISISSFVINYPLIKGAESYYHLSEPVTLLNFFNNPWPVLVSFIPEPLLFLLPPLLALFSILLIFKLSKGINLPERLTFFFLFFLIITPLFIYTFTTISAYSLFIFFSLSGLFLLNKQNSHKYYSIIPLTLAFCFDLLSSFLLAAALIIILFKYKYKNNNDKNSNNNQQNDKQDNKQDNKPNLKSTIILIILASITLLILKKIILNTPYIYGPYHAQQLLPDFISDFGGLGGISFFLIILAFIGLAVTWKSKFYPAYIFVPIIVLAYLFNTQTIFFLGILTIFFASVGFIKLFDQKWILVIIKQFTLLLLLLGIFFSTLTYFNTLPDDQPTKQAQDALLWIEDHIDEDAIVFSLPEESYYLSYLAQREPFFKPHSHDQLKANLTHTILYSNYIQELFPILEENSITLLYVSPKMKSQLGTEQGLLFLLQNERFKMVYSVEQTEIWKFE